MEKREPLKTAAYFENVIRYYELRIADNDADFENRPPQILRWDIMHLLQYDNYFYLLRAYYSAGKPVALILPVYEKIIDHWHAYYAFEEVESTISKLIDTYFEVVQFCTLAILLQPSKSTLDKLETMMKKQPTDVLLNKFAHFLKIETSEKKKLFFKKSFTQLLDVFEQTEIEAKEASLHAYLENWKKLLKPAVYIGSHKIKVNETAFAGYWSFETAAVCIMEQIDPASFRDKPFFPADLVDYYLK